MNSEIIVCDSKYSFMPLLQAVVLKAAYATPEPRVQKLVSDQNVHFPYTSN